MPIRGDEFHDDDECHNDEIGEMYIAKDSPSENVDKINNDGY